MKSKSIFIVILLFIAFLILIFWQGIYIAADKNNTKMVRFSVKKGESLFQISNNLQRQNIIRSALLFEIYVLSRGKQDKLKAGVYFLSPSMSAKRIAETIIQGKKAKVRVTIPEGSTLKEIEKLANSAFGNKSGKVNLSQFKVAQFKDKFSFLADAPSNATLEGFLFPDTYYFSFQDSSAHIAQRMLQNFGKKLNSSLKKEIQKQGKTIFQIVTMASLLEKEVKTYQEKRIVSGILWKRLKYHIPLQVDATIVYLKENANKVLYDDLEIDSPYNTYKHLGLPPGPICNPGLESIKAALFPEKTKFWYYLSTPDGRTLFSKSLKEHNIKKAKYLK